MDELKFQVEADFARLMEGFTSGTPEAEFWRGYAEGLRRSLRGEDGHEAHLSGDGSFARDYRKALAVAVGAPPPLEAR